MTDGRQLGNAAAGRVAALGSVVIGPGLSSAEFTHLEEALGFEFADDHRAFLAAGLPVGGAWPDWRGEGRRSLQKRVQLPAEGVLFDVEWSAFWLSSWGQRPARMKDALRSARYHLAAAPQMIPVFGHHYLPAGRGSFGRPVLSIVRTDVTAVGTDLADYVDRGFGSAGAQPPGGAGAVEFWSTLAD